MDVCHPFEIRADPSFPARLPGLEGPAAMGRVAEARERRGLVDSWVGRVAALARSAWLELAGPAAGVAVLAEEVGVAAGVAVEGVVGVAVDAGVAVAEAPTTTAGTLVASAPLVAIVGTGVDTVAVS